MGREGLECHCFLAWVRAKLVCKPGVELLLQPLNFKRKWLQIHFARDVIYLSVFLRKGLQDWASKECTRGFLIHVSCPDLVRNRYQISPPELVLGYSQRQKLWCVVTPASGCELGTCDWLCGTQKGVTVRLTVLHFSSWVVLELYLTPGAEPGRRAVRNC